VDQVNYAANNANKVLGMLRKTFISRNKDLWKKLYTTLVRPHLEFAVPVWNPQTAGDIETIEKVQKRAARIPIEFRNLSYAERLNEWKLTKLSERRLRGDLIHQMYKILKNHDDISWVRDPRKNLSKNTYMRRGKTLGMTLV
jgi:ribonuclease P/MRP protein subunit RPP40